MVWEWVYNKAKNEDYTPPVYRWQDLKMISPHLRRAVIAAEDQRFLLHHGFDFHEIKEAAKEIISDHKLRGASTISMQTARSLFLLQGRNIFRKLLKPTIQFLSKFLGAKREFLKCISIRLIGELE